VLASNDDYADKLAEGGSLGDSETFQTAVPDASDAPFVFYLDVERLAGAAEAFGETEDIEQLGELTAIGVSGSQDDDLSAVSFRMVFEGE